MKNERKLYLLEREVKFKGYESVEGKENLLSFLLLLTYYLHSVWTC